MLYQLLLDEGAVTAARSDVDDAQAELDRIIAEEHVPASVNIINCVDSTDYDGD